VAEAFKFPHLARLKEDALESIIPTSIYQNNELDGEASSGLPPQPTLMSNNPLG